MKLAARQQQLARYAAVVALVGLLGWAGAMYFSRTPEARSGALVGVAVVVVTGFLSLWLKRNAVERDLNFALLMVVAVFFLRLVALTVAMLWGMSAGLSGVAMVAGFFGGYFVLQAVEIRYALAVHKQRHVSGGAV